MVQLISFGTFHHSNSAIGAVQINAHEQRNSKGMKQPASMVKVQWIIAGAQKYSSHPYSRMYSKGLK